MSICNSTGGSTSAQFEAKTAPYGYRSCIRVIDGERMVACGTNGVDMCNRPDDWRRVSTKGFNVCMVSPNKKLIFLAGERGKIGVIRL